MMAIRISNEHLVIFIVFYSVIILKGLRAFVVPGNNSEIGNSANVNNRHLNDLPVDSPLAFLDAFIVEDTGVSPETIPKEKKIAKRSVSSDRVPQYMMDMYEYLSDKRLKIKFDTARSFRSTGVLIQNASFYKLENELNITARQLVFNISSLTFAEEIQLAQLRIHLQLEIPEENIGSKMKIQIYALVHEELIMVASQDMILSKDSVLAIDVTSSVQLAVTSRMAGLQFTAVLPQEMVDFFIWDIVDGEGPQLFLLSKELHKTELSKDSVVKRMKRSLDQKVDDSAWIDKISDGPDERINSTRKVPWHSVNRVKRNEEEDEEAEEQSNYIVEELGRIRKGKVKKKKNPCRRKPLHINFSAINYDQWIIAPPSYEAFECTGKCTFPMSAHLTPTKHAIIQTLMHSLEPKQISRACCVPTKLDSISVLYLDDDGTVTYKYDYEDMVVAECGCR